MGQRMTPAKVVQVGQVVRASALLLVLLTKGALAIKSIKYSLSAYIYNLYIVIIYARVTFFVAPLVVRTTVLPPAQFTSWKFP